MNEFLLETFGIFIFKFLYLTMVEYSRVDYKFSEIIVIDKLLTQVLIRAIGISKVEKILVEKFYIFSYDGHPK